MTKPIFLKIARAYLLALAISCLLTIIVMLVMKDRTFTLRRPSSAAFLMVSILTYTDYKFWKSFLMSGFFSLVTGLIFLAIWPNGLALTAWQLLGLATALAGLSAWAHVQLNKEKV